MKRFRSIVAHQGGYTMVEMVSVMAIIAVLLGLVIANMTIGNKRQELRDSVAGYVTAARQAENLAGSAQAVNGTSRKAYGVCITSSAIANSRCNQANPASQTLDTYQVYARRTEDVNLNEPPDAPDIISTHRMSRNVVFTAPAAEIWIDYQPPGPTLLAKGTSTQMTVRARITGDTAYPARNVTIKPAAGAVYATN